jgi:hypothetical protein
MQRNKTPDNYGNKATKQVAVVQPPDSHHLHHHHNQMMYPHQTQQYQKLKAIGNVPGLNDTQSLTAISQTLNNNNNQMHT